MPVLTRIASACGFLLFLAAYTPLAYADAYRNPFQSSSAIGQGNAFAAQADEPSAIQYNPAAMTQLRGIQFSAGVQFFSINTHFTSPTGVTATNQTHFPVALPPPGQLFITANLSDSGVKVLENFAVGLGLESLYGYVAKYPQNGPFATTVTSATLPLLDIKPTLAYKINDQLSVGLGADIFTFASFLGEGQFERHFISAGGAGIPAGSGVEVNGTGTTAGMNASILYTPLRNADHKPLLNVGFIWRSQAVLPLNGALLVNGLKVADASSTIRLPEVYTGAIAFWPIRQREREWKVEVDVEYARWRSVRNADVQFSNGVVLSNPLQWRNTFTIDVGTEYRWLDIPRNPGWEVALRAGYSYSMTPIPDQNFDPTIPDNNVNLPTVGAGLLCKTGGSILALSCGDTEGRSWQKAIGLDVAFAAFLFGSRTVTGSPNPTVNGTYQSTNYLGTLTFRVQF